MTPIDGRPAFLAAFISPGEKTPSIKALPEEILVSPSASFLLQVAEAEARLSELVPSYVMPKFIAVGQMPLGPTGKLDRHYLRDAIAAMSGEELRAFTAPLPKQRCMPSSEAEIALQHVFAEVLNISTTSIGVHDSFFRLGGDS